MRRPLLLNGFMGTGKSSVGRLVAERSGHPLIDLDSRIEQKAGATVQEIFATRGEDAFRELERQELLAAMREHTAGSGPPPVIALGGGSLLRREVRLRALDEAVVVTLYASPAELLARGVANGRPLLAGADPLEKINELLEARSRAYTEAHGRISTDGKTAEAVASEVIAVWLRDPIAVAADERSYVVDVGARNVLDSLSTVVASAPVILLVSDDNVFPLHGQTVLAALSASGARVTPVLLKAGEQFKTPAAPAEIWTSALAAGADRKSIFVALGGGVVSDITGFAAASWMRGVRWVGIPTTLLSMVDASVGGKTGVDFGAAKNAVGAFWQPSRVLCDVSLSATEPERGHISALSEVVKTAIIGDPGLFELLEAQVGATRQREPQLVAELVRRSVRVKARIVSLDERESGLRATLNLGHTLGHAMEAQGGYTALTHGEAISLGLVAALRIGEKLGVTPVELSERTIALLGQLGLPIDLAAQPLRKAIDLVGHDKKRAGARLTFVVARALGQVETMSLELDGLRALASELL